VVYWQKFYPDDFAYEFDEDELAAHGITVDEAIEVLWNQLTFEEIRNSTAGIN